MADISGEINAIRTARYGEEVRGALVDALNAVNDQVEDDTTSAGTSATAAAGSAAAAAETLEATEQIAEDLSADLADLHATEAAIETAEAGREAAEAARVVAEQERADAASGYVNQCAEYTNQARQYASSDNALLSQSWAIGGTATRYGEDTNNSKYWAEIAAQVVTEGGVASFNGRTGNVMPVAGDYDTTLISRGTGTVESALQSIETELAERTTADTATNTVTFTSGDSADADANAWTTVNPLASGETHATLLGKISTMMKNVRFLFKKLGTTDISSIGNGTVTGALSTLNSNLSGLSIQRGRYTFTAAANSQTEVTIPFPNPYSESDSYVLTIGLIMYSAAKEFSYMVRSKTASGFVVRIYNNTASASNGQIDWITMKV